MGVCLWKHQGLKGKELPHFLPWPLLSTALTASPLTNNNGPLPHPIVLLGYQ